MSFAVQQVAQQPPALTLGQRQDAEAKVEDVYRSSLVEVPAVPSGGRKGHLARG